MRGGARRKARLILLDDAWTTGAHRLCLPPYSPNLNPIDTASAKFNELLRQAQARTVDALWEFIGHALDFSTPEDSANYVRHCGYNPP